MAIKSVYLPEPEFTPDGTALRITGDELHHLTVSRVEAGESIEVFDSRWSVWTATVESVGKKEILARVLTTRTMEPDPLVPLLAIALVRPAAFEFAIEKAVEIGVRRIMPFTAARSNTAPPKKMDRWERIIVEAAKQSKRYVLPKIDPPCRFEVLVTAEPVVDCQTRVIFAEQGGGRLASAVAGLPAVALIGPEGGWAPTELTLAKHSGFAAVTLDTGILRTETAAIAGLALLRHALS